MEVFLTAKISTQISEDFEYFFVTKQEFSTPQKKIPEKTVSTAIAIKYI